MSPFTIAKGIKRLWGMGGGPSSNRVIADCDRTLCAFGVVYKAGRRMVPELANRSGHHNHAEGRNNAGWVGVQLKSMVEVEVGCWLHFQSLEINAERAAKLIESLATVGKSELSSDEEEDSDVYTDVVVISTIRRLH